MDGPTTVAIAMFAGVAAQAVAQRLRVPGIVLLLATGIVLGPDVVGWVDPAVLGDSLHSIVGYGVAVILFEGGLNLDIARLRREGTAIRRLVTVGAVMTAVGAALSVTLALGWPWRTAVLFGSLVVVTGPTVITPLLRRINVVPSVETILEAEGVFIDAIGAIVAAAGLEFALSPSAASLSSIATNFAGRVAVGSAMGACGGFLIWGAVRWRNGLPKGLENVFSLATAIAVFELSNSILRESGIAAAVVAGFVVGNSGLREVKVLAEFKGHLTVLLISVLFVLLAAGIRVEQVWALGLGGVATVLALMFAVRPAVVWICAWGAGLSAREKLFISWLAPRGIVAAAVATLFAQRLTASGVPGGADVSALVFLVIAVTVGVQGLTGGWVARILGVKRSKVRGVAIMGANAVACAIGSALAARGQEVVLVDSNPNSCRKAEDAGLRVLFGNALGEPILQRAKVSRRVSCIGVTINAEANYIFAETVLRDHRGPTVSVAVSESESGVKPDMLETLGARLLFGAVRDIGTWNRWFERAEVRVAPWVYQGDVDASTPYALGVEPTPLLPLVWLRDGAPRVVEGPVLLAPGDTVDFAVHEDDQAAAVAYLRDRGFAPVPD